MTPDSVRAAIAAHVHHAQDDPERWHGFRDQLLGDVLHAIEAGHDQPVHLAAAALEACAVAPRWEACA